MECKKPLAAAATAPAAASGFDSALKAPLAVLNMPAKPMVIGMM